MGCVCAPSDVTEVATRREAVRRALLTEADEPQLLTTQLQNAFHRLTPELSRPVAGRRTRASVAHKHVADATMRGRLERIVRQGATWTDGMA